MSSEVKVSVDEYVSLLRTQIGVKFKHQGRLWNHSLDCVGLMVEACKILGVEYNDNTSYEYIVNEEMFLTLMRTQLDQIEIHDARKGDVLVFFVLGNAQHIAMITDIEYDSKNNKIYKVIHAYMPSRKVIEHYLPTELKSKIAYCFRSKFLTE